MNKELAILQDVLKLLAAARFDLKGADLMNVAEVIHHFHALVQEKVQADSVVPE